MTDLDLLVARASAAGVTRPYKFGAVPSSPDYPYAVLSMAPGAPQVRTLDGTGKRIGRFSAQIFSRTAEMLLEQDAAMFAAFDAVELSEFDGDPVCWQEIATTPYRDPDTSGVLDITHTYRF